MKPYIFVYGTLRKGQRANDMLSRCEFVGEATMSGSLLDLGSYPGMVEDMPGTVKGELYELKDDATISLLDRYEGYLPMREFNLYERRVRWATLPNGERVKAFVYIYARPSGLERRIESGDYLERG